MFVVWLALLTAGLGAQELTRATSATDAALEGSAPREEGARPAGQAQYDPDVDGTFEASVDRERVVTTTFRSHGLEVTKAMQPDGSSRRVLTFGAERIVIENDVTGTRVSRDGQVAFIDAKKPDLGAFDAVRALLLRSRAVDALKRVADRIERSGRLDAYALSMLTDAAFVRQLDGDSTALERTGRALAAAARARRTGPRAVPALAGIGPVAASGEVVQFRDCLGEMYAYIARVWDEFWACLLTANEEEWYLRGIHHWWCQREFEIRMTVGLSQFIECAVPFI